MVRRLAIGYTFILSTMSETYPELEALAGPLKGNSFPFSDPEMSIGREPSNQMPILDASVSRRHCLIRREADGFKIQDLKSRNSTFVNGVPVTEKLLVFGRRNQDREFFIRFREAGGGKSNRAFGGVR